MKCHSKIKLGQMRITFSDTCVHLIHIKYNEGEAWQDYLIQRVTITIYVQQLYITPPTQPPGVSIDKILHKKIMTIVLSQTKTQTQIFCIS